MMKNTKLIRILAEGVMGWEYRTGIIRGGHWIGEGIDMMLAVSDWDPLTNWNDCMMLVEQMREDEFFFYLTDQLIEGERTTRAEFCKNAENIKAMEIGVKFSNDDKEAICKAAGKARGLIDE